MTMKILFLCLAAVALIAPVLHLTSCSRASAGPPGPNGGDIVPIQSGTVKAEVVTSATTGEVMVHTWDPALKHHTPLDAEPMTIGSGDHTLRLDPHPLATDPSGTCSRFYGQADWVRAGSFRQGWLQCCGGRGSRETFAWRHCWTGGREHEGMWAEMGEHRRGVGNAGGPMGPGMGGHR
jgi:hypothetical protein